MCVNRNVCVEDFSVCVCVCVGDTGRVVYDVQG